MKDTKRLSATAHVNNNPFGIIELTFDDHDGGDFQLYPKVDDNAIYLADPYQARYALKITGNNPDVLKRVARELNALAKKLSDAEDLTE